MRRAIAVSAVSAVSAVAALLIAVVPLLGQDNNQVHRSPNTEIVMVSRPAQHLSKDWVFVVDGSASMKGVFAKTKRAFFEATSFSSDDWHFAAITFDDAGQERFRDWVDASLDELSRLETWIDERPRSRKPVLSYGAKAIQMALQQEKRELTIILITDGGFTEVSRAGGNFQVMRDVIDDGQQWRSNRNLPHALICCLGIENPHYRAGNKPPDGQCQDFLRGVGERSGGGYFLVRNR